MKKIVTRIMVAAMAAVLAIAPAAVAGCDGETSTTNCEHSVSEWTLVQEPTCSTEGIIEGICGICLQTVQQTIPIDEDAHAYGDWEVGTPYPSLTNGSVAIKTCSECGNFIRVDLPTIDDYNYTSQVTSRPTATKSGTSLYTYPHELGDITFEIAIDSSGIQTVSDAVSIGSSSESRDLVRSVTGTRGDKRVDSGAITSTVLAEMEASNKSFSYELYDEYTHISADDGSEFWLGYDDGELYGYTEDVQGNFTILDNLQYIDGFRFYETYSDTLSVYYGTENFLAGLYAYAKANYNGDFEEEVTTTAKQTVYSFSFGTYTIYSGGINGALFSKIEVSFTLSSSYTIESFEYYSVTYANDSSAYNAETGGWTSDATFDFDDNGNAYVTNGSGLKFIEKYTVEQTLRQSGETEQTSPYTPDTRFYSDVEVTYNDSVITDSTVIELPAGSSTGYVFGLNLSPADIIGDTITFYYRTYNSDGTYTDTEIDYGTESTVGIFVYYNSSTNKFYLKSNIAGDVHLVVKTKKCSQEFVVNFYKSVPTAFYSTVYNYGGSVGYVINTSSDDTASATVYAGQPLYFKASLSASEAGYKTETFYTIVTAEDGTVVYNSQTDISDATICDVTDAYALETASGEVDSVSVFRAYTAGNYTITLVSTETDAVTCTITVTVDKAPEVSELLSGTYTGTFADSKEDVSITFTGATEQTLDVEVYEGDGDDKVLITSEVVQVTVTATITYDGSTLPIVCTYYYYNTADGKQLLDANYARIYGGENILDSVMQNEDTEGLYDDDQIFRLMFNEAYDLVLQHSFGIDDAVESVILSTQS
ncbi:MAG: hypothetical protein LUD19_00670 [Clostridia bacterium]|nr:hypothetical protein [Clostridia bacterium]